MFPYVSHHFSSNWWSRMGVFDQVHTSSPMTFIKMVQFSFAFTYFGPILPCLEIPNWIPMTCAQVPAGRRGPRCESLRDLFIKSLRYSILRGWDHEVIQFTPKL